MCCCDVAFARIFRAFDADCDSLLSDGELNTFQARVASIDRTTDSI